MYQNEVKPCFGTFIRPLDVSPLHLGFIYLYFYVSPLNVSKTITRSCPCPKYILFIDSIHVNCKLEIRNTSIDVHVVHVPPKRNIFSKTIVDIGSTHRDGPYETIMLELSIIFFPPVRSEPTFGENLPENEHSRVRTVRVKKILYITATLLFHMKISAE